MTTTTAVSPTQREPKRENWEAGDHSMHHPYQPGHGRGPSAADAASAAAVPGGA